MQKMRGKITEPLVSSSTLVQIEWERTHLKEDNWPNISRCQTLSNYVINYIIILEVSKLGFACDWMC
jgi:hypothetical protein